MPDDVARRVTALEEHVSQIWAHLLNVEEEYRIDVLNRTVTGLHHSIKDLYARVDRLDEQEETP